MRGHSRKTGIPALLALIRSVRLLDQVEGNVPHLICPHSLASSSRLKQKEETDVNKKRRNGGGIQSLVVITAAVREGREEDGKAEGSLWILAETSDYGSVCLLRLWKPDRSRSRKEIDHHGDGRRGRRPKRKQQKGTIVFFIECFKCNCK